MWLVTTTIHINVGRYNKDRETRAAQSEHDRQSSHSFATPVRFQDIGLPHSKHVKTTERLVAIHIPPKQAPLYTMQSPSVRTTACRRAVAWEYMTIQPISAGRRFDPVSGHHHHYTP